MVQNNCMFGGLPNEDPNTHLDDFLEICDTFQINGVSNDAIRLRLFSFLLRDKAKKWLKSFPTRTFTTWNQLAKKFLKRYFPPSKMAKLRNDIAGFLQQENETLYDLSVVESKRAGLSQKDWHPCDRPYDSLNGQLEAMSKKMDALTMSSSRRQTQVMTCDWCGGGHQCQDCQNDNTFAKPKQIDYVGNASGQQNNPYSNTYNPGGEII
ncbi:uncharacterized protein LOC107261968 [Ricinus communis]|uniref:uncharacterized protein LOC107261968 n=1 Tax=Ricinus communis TaxID=3988 RepID=UPI0007725BC5|nr:uncharacterized protein LOC107261968 [Ricinus communis]|eukprot:XP_015580158.1 uncharacterized protein LOC107261968 [Ricinus communis]